VTALAEGVAQVVASFQGREGAATLTVMPLLQPPDPPTDLAQLKSDGDAPIPSGGTTDERTVVFRAGVSDPNPEDRLRLEVEVQPVGTPFSDTPTGSSVEVRNGGVATVAITLDDGTDYRWRARAIDQTGRSGPWVAFGDEEADFRVETPVTRLAFATQPSGTSAGATISPAVRVAARKASGDTDAAFSGEITLRLAPGTGTSGATLSGTRTVAAVAGVATFDDLAIDVTGEGYRLEASSAGLPEVQSAAFDVAPAGAGRLAFVVQPTEVRAGEAIAPAVEVAVRDEFGNPVPDATDVVTLAIAEGTGIAGAALSGTVSVAAVDGVARFDDLAIDSAGPGYALTARATDLVSATSAEFAVVPGPTASITFTAQPGDTPAGAALSPAVEVTARDAVGNPATGFTGNVTVGFATDPSGGTATLEGTLTVAAVAGVATFDDLSVDVAGEGYTLAANADGLPEATSAAFTITAAAASQLAFTVEPSEAVAGEAISPAVRVTAFDDQGNVDTDFMGDITVAIATGTGTSGATLSGTRTVAAVSGVATFAELAVDSAGADYRLAAGADGLTGSMSAEFTIVPGNAAQLAFTVQPGNTPAGAPMDPAVEVTARDALGNRATGFTGNVTVSLATDPSDGAATLGETLTVAAVAGVATFDDLNVDVAAEGYTLAAGADGLAGATSAAFDIFSSTATRLEFTQQPTATVAGQPITPAVEVTAFDDQENVATDFTGSVTVTIAEGTGAEGATLSGTRTVAAMDGVATFDDLSVDRAATGYRLAAAAGGVTPDTSVMFDITPARAASVAIETGDGQTATAGTAVTVAPAVRVEDEFGNPVAGVTVTFTPSGTGSVTGETPTTDADGIAAVGSWTLGETAEAESDTLTATVDGVGSVELVATATAGGAASVAIETGDGQTATVGTTVPVAPSVRVEDEFGNPVAGTTVTFTASGTGSVTGEMPTTDADGIAAVGSWTLGETAEAESDTLTATVDGVGSVELVATATAGGAASVAIEAGDDQIATVRMAVDVAPSVRVEDEFGNPVASVTVAFTASGTGSVTGETPTTGADGIAEVGSWTLGETAEAESDTLTATVDGVGSVEFVATATAGEVSADESIVAADPLTISADGETSTITVTARDAEGNLLEGLAVTLAATGDGNTLVQPETSTDASGVATGTLSSIRPGEKSVSAMIDGVQVTDPVTLTVTAGTAATMTLEDGDAQTATAGSAVEIPPAVLVTDQHGNPVPGVAVTFTVTSGGGVVDPSTPVSTNTDGIAAVTSWTLGTEAGTNTLDAVVDGLDGSPVTFTAVGEPGLAGHLAMVTHPSSSVTAGQPFAQQPVVELRDDLDNPVETAGVLVSSAIQSGPGGSLGGTTTVATDENGRATFTDLAISGTAGTYRLRFNADNVTGVESEDIVVVAGAAADLAIETGDGQTATVGTTVPVAPAVRVEDEFGNPVADVLVTFTPSGTGSVTGGTPTTDADGIAAVGSWTLGETAEAESDTLTATVDGVGSVEFVATATAGAATGAESTIAADPATG
ncbi:MAG: Ig-like domain-containing protein, partial [Gemmatimonadota bacterium]